MRKAKLISMLVGVLLVALAAGCGSTGGVVERGPAPVTVDQRQQIINEHEVVAAQKLQELKDTQEGELRQALAPLDSEEQEAVKQLEDQLKKDIEPDKEEAQATLSDEELDARLKEIQDKYDSDLQEGVKGIRNLYTDKREQAKTEFSGRHGQELTDLQAQLDKELQDKLAEYDKGQAQMAADQAAREQAVQQQAAREQAARDLAAREQAAHERAARAQAAPVRQAPAGPAPGTKAPVQPVVVPSPPPVAEQGLRREGDAPLGQRRRYVNKYFRTGEALQEIKPSEDMMNREHHEIVVTFWMAGSENKAVPQFMLNRVPIRSWQELEQGLARHRAMLISEHHILYPKVILDQQRDVPRSVVDDILSVCFRVGIKHISMGNKEPRMEQ